MQGTSRPARSSANHCTRPGIRASLFQRPAVAASTRGCRGRRAVWCWHSVGAMAAWSAAPHRQISNGSLSES